MDLILKADANHLHRMVYIMDDIRTRELLDSKQLPEENGLRQHKDGPPFRLAALRGMYDDGRLIVRPLTALNSNLAIWRHFACKSCLDGHSQLAVHYFDRNLVKKATGSGVIGCCEGGRSEGGAGEQRLVVSLYPYFSSGHAVELQSCCK